MNFELTEEQIAVRNAAKDFAQNILKSGVIERDREQKFPTEEIKQLGELGFMGIMVNPEYGGSGMDTLSYVLAIEEISKIDASASVVMSVNNSLVCYGIETYGTEEQKKKLIAGIVLTGGGSQLKHLKQLVEYVTGMDTRIGLPNEHLAGNNSVEISNPTFATAVGLVMNSMEKRKNISVNKNQSEDEDDLENDGKDSSSIEAKASQSIFEKFTEKIKTFLENAE